MRSLFSHLVFLATVVTCLGPLACKRETKSSKADGQLRPVVETESPSAETETSAIKRSTKPAPGKLTPAAFCKREGDLERTLLEGKTFLRPWHGACVIDKSVAWTKRLLSIKPGQVDEYEWSLVRYEDGREIVCPRDYDTEFTTTGPLVLFDALDDVRKEVFLSSDYAGPEGTLAWSLLGFGLHKEQLNRIETVATSLRPESAMPKSVVVDTSFEELGVNCGVGEETFSAPGIELVYSRSQPNSPLALDRAALKRELEAKCQDGHGPRGEPRARTATRHAHCALARGRPLAAVEKTLETCKPAKYRKDCSAPLPPNECDGWEALLESLPGLFALLGNEPPLFEWGGAVKTQP